jgi:valyl-tRNA synthetase
MDVVRAVRNLRAEKKLDAKLELKILAAAVQDRLDLLAAERTTLRTLARANVEALDPAAGPPKGAATQMAGQVQVFLPLEGLLDTDAERRRLEKERQKVQGLLAAQNAKLGNAAFVAKAPAAVVALERSKVAEWEGALAGLERTLAELGA